MCKVCIQLSFNACISMMTSDFKAHCDFFFFTINSVVYIYSCFQGCVKKTNKTTVRGFPTNSVLIFFFLPSPKIISEESHKPNESVTPNRKAVPLASVTLQLIHSLITLLRNTVR